MRLIDADELLNNTIYNPFHAPYITKQDVINAPTINATIRKPRESRRKLPCTCGCKHIGMWIGAHTNQCRCDNCGKQGPTATTEIDAIRGWNKLIEEGEHEAD